MKLIFNDAAELTIQSADIQPDGGLSDQDHIGNGRRAEIHVPGRVQD